MNKSRQQWLEFFYHNAVDPSTNCFNGIRWIEYVPRASSESAVICVIYFASLCHNLQSLIHLSIVAKLVKCLLITRTFGHVKLGQVALKRLNFLEIHLIN